MKGKQTHETSIKLDYEWKAVNWVNSTHFINEAKRGMNRMLVLEVVRMILQFYKIDFL